MVGHKTIQVPLVCYCVIRISIVENMLLYFHYWFICWLFSELIVWLINCQKTVRNQFPRVKGSRLQMSCFVWATVQNWKIIQLTEKKHNWFESNFSFIVICEETIDFLVSSYRRVKRNFKISFSVYLTGTDAVYIENCTIIKSTFIATANL